ncbi:MAG: hypothetical protein IPL28_09175 [Chloroflexi bacterium]|nr:hypothetical protein [Chloroflexota bacterium]
MPQFLNHLTNHDPHPHHRCRGHAQVVADALQCRQRTLAEPLHLLGFVDDNPHLWGKPALACPFWVA